MDVSLCPGKGAGLARKRLLLHSLRDGDEQRPRLRISRIDPDAPDQKRPPALDGVVGVQLARVCGMRAEQLEMDLDLPVLVKRARRDLKAAAAGKLHLRGGLPVEIEALLLEQLVAAEAELLAESLDVRPDGRELGIHPGRGRRVVGGRDGAHGDADALQRDRMWLPEQQRCEKKDHSCAPRSSDIQITVVSWFSCSTAPSCVPKSTSWTSGPLASARSAPSSRNDAGVEKIAIATAA